VTVSAIITSNNVKAQRPRTALSRGENRIGELRRLRRANDDRFPSGVTPKLATKRRGNEPTMSLVERPGIAAMAADETCSCPEAMPIDAQLVPRSRGSDRALGMRRIATAEKTTTFGVSSPLHSQKEILFVGFVHRCKQTLRQVAACAENMSSR